MKNNVIINLLYGDKIFDSIEIYISVESLQNIKSAKKILLYNNISNKNLNNIKKYYDEIIPCFADGEFTGRQSILEFLLSRQSQYNYILISDIRDVIFQCDPFEYLEHYDKDIYMINEGMTVDKSIPNHNWMLDLSKTLMTNNKNYFMNAVINGGIFAGKQEHLMFLLVSILTNMDRNSSNFIHDQTVLTFLNLYLLFFHNVEICNPHSSNFCITGEAIAKFDFDFNYDNNFNFLNNSNNFYYIVHQWDRTPLKNNIISKFKRNNNYFLENLNLCGTDLL